MNKYFILATAVAVLPAVAMTATSSELHVKNSTVIPGEMNELADFEVSASGNDSLTDLNPSISIPTNYNIDPDTVDSLTNDSVNFSLTITPDSSFEPGDYSTDFTLSSQEQTFEKSLSYTVPEQNKWNITPMEASADVINGEEGVLENFTIYQNSNKDVEVGISISGNISDIIDPVPPQNTYPTVNSSFDLSYNIGNSLTPGLYNGTMNVSEQETGKYTKANISLNVSDTQKPSFGLSQVDDVEATLSEEFKIKISDNVAVDNVIGNVRREYQVQSSNNTTELKNESITVLDFEKTDSDTYSAEFSESEVIGDYYVTVKATDTSGNEEEIVKEFEVVPLDSLKVPSDTVNFGSIVSGEEKRVEAFEIEEDTQINVTNNGITPENATIEIGIRGEDDSATRLLGDDGYVVLNNAGEYYVEAKPDGTELSYRFNGELEFETVEQHVEVSDLYFEGKAILDYPEPRNVTSRGLQAMAYYTYDANGDPEEIVRKVMRDASACRGLQDIKECAGDPNLDKVDDQGEIIDAQKSKLDLFKFGMIFSWVVFIGYIGASRRRSSLAGLQKVQYELDYGFSKDVPGVGVSKWNPDNHFGIGDNED